MTNCYKIIILLDLFFIADFYLELYDNKAHSIGYSPLYLTVVLRGIFTHASFVSYQTHLECLLLQNFVLVLSET